MDFNLTEEEQMIQKEVHDFAQREIRPKASDLDRTSEFPTQIIKQLAQMNIMGISVPEEYDGSGASTISYALAVEEISAACASCGVIVSVHNSLVCDPILKYGTPEQKEKYLKPLARGEMLGCFALTEANAGSDAGAGKTKAELKGDKYILNGSKIFITQGSQADLAIIIANLYPQDGAKGLCAFIVEKGFPGFKVGKLEEKMGINASGTAELVFEDCEVPKENLLGLERKGFSISLAALDSGRIGIAAQAVGIARAAMEESIKYSKERIQFGKPIASFQAIQWMIADMATEIDAARLLVFKAAATKDSGKNFSTEAAMAKLFASEICVKTTNKAIQVHGGYGYMKEYAVERHYRDAKITEIYEGTSEIQRLVIASSLLR